MIWRLVPGTFRDLFRTWWKCSEGAGERSFWQYLTPDRNGERRRRIWKVESSCSLWSECSTWNGRSFPGSGWTGARTPSEQKGNVVYPLNDTRWTSLVSQSTWHRRRSGQGSTWTCLLFCKFQVLPLVGHWNKSNKELCEHMEKWLKCSVSWTGYRTEFLALKNIYSSGISLSFPVGPLHSEYKRLIYWFPTLRRWKLFEAKSFAVFLTIQYEICYQFPI